ncbi:RHS repeat-associated core domain-containing protein [Streptomyces sedi]|uniref:RHS repeat-associated core domain-containing protein n=1 Tax=Streptomyces sedi TaxID=555059 RepID=UPI001FEA3A7D|nr:RHS repeat-associated core domain-containing protein [Streptomyces sedi]
MLDVLTQQHRSPIGSISCRTRPAPRPTQPTPPHSQPPAAAGAAAATEEEGRAGLATAAGGGQRGEATDSWPGDRGFLGGTADPTGTTHLGAREYDPTLGRFLSVDPLLIPNDPRQHNPYQYGNNNPLTFSDPTGEAFEECRSGQYKCNYDRKGKLTGVEYGKNYEKITRSVGGTPAPRYIRQNNASNTPAPKTPAAPEPHNNRPHERNRHASLNEPPNEPRPSPIANSRTSVLTS